MYMFFFNCVIFFFKQKPEYDMRISDWSSCVCSSDLIWLWLTAWFGNFAEAIAEGRGKAQAASLRATRDELKAKKLVGVGSVYGIVRATELTVDEIVIVETGDLIPADGEDRKSGV